MKTDIREVLIDIYNNHLPKVTPDNRFDDEITGFSIEIPADARGSARKAMIDAASADENCPAGVSEFDMNGKWSRAARFVQHNTMNYAQESGRRFASNDWVFNALINVMKGE